MSRCVYKNNNFEIRGSYSPRSEFGIHDRTDQCWMDGDIFIETPEGKSGPYCIFHAPFEKSVSTHSIDLDKIHNMQTETLTSLINSWNDENTKLKLSCKELIPFVLIGANFGAVDFKNMEFPWIIDLSKSVFHGVASFNSSKFMDDVTIRAAVFLEGVDFSKAEFNKEARFDSTKFNKKTYFALAKFKGRTDFSETQIAEATFSQTQFHEYTLFTEAAFKGNAIFTQTTFELEVQFKRTIFDFADFTAAEFGKLSIFENAVFNSSANFYLSRFGGNVLKFLSTKFMGWAHFNSAVFDGDASFYESEFANLFFGYNKCNSGVRFIQCKFDQLEYKTHLGNRLVFDTCVCNEKLNFESQDCSSLLFLNMKLDKADFLCADIRKTIFDACLWEQSGKGLMKYSTVFEHQKNFAKEEGKQEKDYHDKLIKLRTLYRLLKKNLEDNHDFKQAGDFHYWEMLLREKLLREGIIKSESFLERYILRIYRLISDYGENYIKLFLFLLLSLFVSACAFSIIDLYANKSILNNGLCDIAKVCCDNVINIILLMLPLGSGKMQPTAITFFIGKVVIVFQALITFVLGALFVMAINRRFRR